MTAVEIKIPASSATHILSWCSETSLTVRKTLLYIYYKFRAYFLKIWLAYMRTYMHIPISVPYQPNSGPPKKMLTRAPRMVVY